MKNIHTFRTSALLLGIMAAFMTSCIEYNERGPKGKDGTAFFGIDYDTHPPYSYWDDNPRIPLNPYLGEMYRSDPGTYDFEYFINPWEYWWGTYTLYENPGEWGDYDGRPGRPGDDTFLLLICNEDGFYTEAWEECGCYEDRNRDGFTVVEGSGLHKFKIEMKKAHINDRPAQGEPKFKRRN